MTGASSILRLIDAAYQVGDTTDQFPLFLDEVETYLFEDVSAVQIIRQNLVNDQSLSMVARHTDRIMQMIARSLEDQKTITQSNHAVLLMSTRGFELTGNIAAQKLLSCSFPIRLDDLPIDGDTLQKIKSAVVSGSQADKICLAMIGDVEISPCLALIQRPPDHEGTIRIAISYIEWSTALLARIAKALELTESEAEVLEGHLSKLTQKDIAIQRNRSLETVKAQSKSILRKAGASKMSEVVQLSAGIAYLYRLSEDMDDFSTVTEWVTPKSGLHISSRPDGTRFSWYEVGTGSRPILFVHGLFQGPFFTEALIQQLSKADFHLLCPSRPGFGYSDPSPSRSKYSQTIVDDVKTLLDAKGINRCLVINHQGGTNHAFRIANALGPHAIGLFLIDSGVPHTEADLELIERNSRILAAAAMRTPSLLKMICRIGKNVYKKRGVRAFLERTLGSSPHDLTTLEDPELFRLQAFGAFHVAQQSSEIWVREGETMMRDWNDDFHAFKGRQYWLQGKLATVCDVRVIERYLKRHATPDIELKILSDAGNTLLYTHPKDIVEGIKKFHTA